MRSAIAMLAAAAATLVNAAPAQAQSGEDRDKALVKCAAIPSMSERLVCFEAVARDAGARTASSPSAAPGASAAAAPSSPPPAPARATAADFGAKPSRAERAERAKTSDEIQARAVGATSMGPGRWVITLDTGARWAFAETVADFRPPRTRDTVRIRRGSFGGYLLHVDNQPGVRVARIQ